MKRIYAFAAVLLMAGAACFAQDKNNDNAKKHNSWESIKAEKIGFLTDKLDLTVEEAQAFWPVYNAYMKDLSAAEKTVRHDLWSLKPKKDETISDKEMVNRINDYVKAKSNADDVFAKYSKEFLKVLSPEKVGRLYLAEEQFNRIMVNKLAEKKAAKHVQERERYGNGKPAQPAPAEKYNPSPAPEYN